MRFTDSFLVLALAAQDVAGTAVKSSSSAAAQTSAATFCLQGQSIYSTAASYQQQCDRRLSGKVIAKLRNLRDTKAASTQTPFQTCLSNCDVTEGCVSAAYIGDLCVLLSSVEAADVYTGAQAAVRSTYAAQVRSILDNPAKAVRVRVAAVTTSSAKASSAAPSASKASSSTALASVPSGFSSLGCYIDSSTSRALSYQQNSSSTTNTPSDCALKCQKLNYKYSGTEYGKECYCGNVLPASKLLTADSDCNMTCTGNKTQTCGAGSRLSLVADNNWKQSSSSSSTTSTSSAKLSTSTKPVSSSVKSSTTLAKSSSATSSLKASSTTRAASSSSSSSSVVKSSVTSRLVPPSSSHASVTSAAHSSSKASSKASSTTTKHMSSSSVKPSSSIKTSSSVRPIPSSKTSTVVKSNSSAKASSSVKLSSSVKPSTKFSTSTRHSSNTAKSSAHSTSSSRASSRASSMLKSSTTLATLHPAKDLAASTSTKSSSSSVRSTSSSKANSSSRSSVRPSSSSTVSSKPASSTVSSKPASSTVSSKPASSSSVKASSSTVKASSSSTKTSSTTATYTGVAYTSKKRGLAFNAASLTAPFTGGQVSWAYNWYNQAGSGFNSALKFIPLLFNNDPSLTDVWSSRASAAIAAGADALMSFNEPDACFSGSSCMNVTAAAAAYKQYMQPFAGKALLGAPSVTNGDAPYGLTWLQSFLGACTNCQIDFINLHWYSNKYAGASYFESYINSARKIANGKPIWITEFGLTDDYTDADVIAFLKQVLPWLDQQKDIARYAYFMDSPGILISSDGTAMSDIGSVYNTYTNSTTQPNLY